jgi:hypothetical protein
VAGDDVEEIELALVRRHRWIYLLLVPALSVAGTLGGAWIGAQASYRSVQAQLDSENQRAAEATLEGRSATFIASANQLGVLADLNTNGSNTQQIDNLQIQADSQCYVLLLGTTRPGVRNAANALNGVLIQLVRDAESGQPDPAIQVRITSSINQLVKAINPTVTFTASR